MDYLWTPPNPNDLPHIPHEFWWSGQRDGVEQITQLLMSGTKAVMVNGPTGAGKSLTGLASASLYSQLMESDLNVTVLTQTKDLQGQYAEEFPDARAATGRGNWQCGAAPERNANRCPNIGTEGCNYSCPYRRQREEALDSPIRAVNYAYYGATGGMFHAPFMVTDEADYLGELLVQAKSEDLGLLVDEYGLQVPQGIIEQKPFAKTIDDIRISTAKPEELEVCKRALAVLRSNRYVMKGVGNSIVPWPESRIVQDFVRQPTLIMSATVFAPQYWAKEWGIDVGWVELPCAVPPENRPINMLNVKKINTKTTESEWREVVDALDNIITSMVESKGVIHSVSNWLTDFILQHSRYKYLMHRAAGSTRLKGIKSFLDASNGILIGPQLLRGINLPDDQCRYIIFPKVPFPSMVDPRVKEMLKGGEDRYLVETLSSIIQGAGRGIRHRDDKCETFILDSNAGYLFNRTKDWLPNWFREALIWNTK